MYRVHRRDRAGLAALLAAASLGSLPGAFAHVPQADRLAGGILCVGNRCPYHVTGDEGKPLPAADARLLAQGGLPLCVANRCPKRKPAPVKPKADQKADQKATRSA